MERMTVCTESRGITISNQWTYILLLFCHWQKKKNWKKMCGYKELQTYVILSHLWLAGGNSLQRRGKRIYSALLFSYWEKENERFWQIKDSFKIYMYFGIQAWTSQMFYLKLFMPSFSIIVWKKMSDAQKLGLKKK